MGALYDKYQKMNVGGSAALFDGLQAANQTATQGAISAVAGPFAPVVRTATALGSGIIDAVAPKDEYGVTSNVAAIEKGIITGGPVGALLGYFGNMAAKKDRGILRNQIYGDRRRNEQQLTNTGLASDPSKATGSLTASYFAHGGTVGETKSTMKNPEAYTAFGTAAQQAYDHGWYPGTKEANPVYRNSYNKAFNEVIIPNEKEYGYMGLTNTPTGFRMHIYNSAGQPLKEVGRDMNYDQVTQYMTNNAGPVAGRVRQIAKETASRKNGGTIDAPLSNEWMRGGTGKSLSSTSMEVSGNTHNQGGIKVPSMGIELEHGETTSGNFVFSKELGFANAHKPIAKAIGKIEKKPQTRERINSLNLLKSREKNLALSQEYFKQVNGLA